MALSEAQIERFSRQIILPQVGGVGQQRLLAASVAIGGAGEAMATAARYLAGAGIGRIALHGHERERLATALAGLGTEALISTSAEPLGMSPLADVLLAADLSLADLDRAAAGTAPVIAGGTTGPGGWLVVSGPGGACAGCAARAAQYLGGAATEEPRDRSKGSFPSCGGRNDLASTAAGVIGSLIALETLKLLLGLQGEFRPVWLHFDALASTLTELPLTRLGDCAVCAARSWP